MQGWKWVVQRALDFTSVKSWASFQNKQEESKERRGKEGREGGTEQQFHPQSHSDFFWIGTLPPGGRRKAHKTEDVNETYKCHERYKIHGFSIKTCKQQQAQGRRDSNHLAACWLCEDSVAVTSMTSLLVVGWDSATMKLLWGHLYCS